MKTTIILLMGICLNSMVFASSDADSSSCSPPACFVELHPPFNGDPAYYSISLNEKVVDTHEFTHTDAADQHATHALTLAEAKKLLNANVCAVVIDGN